MAFSRMLRLSLPIALLICCGLFGAFSVVQAQNVLVGLTSEQGLQGGGTAFAINSNGTGFTIRNTFMKLGFSPLGDLTKGTDGNFYGMTSEGGVYGAGTIFVMTPTGNATILHHFANYDGYAPYGNLIQGTDGNFYGMATSGGSKNFGTVFKITPSGTFTLLHNFSSDGYSTGGSRPFGSLIQGTDGNFYGMTYGGGLYTYGTIFRITPAGVHTVLYSFNGSTEGGYPSGNLVQGNDSNFYGLTSYGGSTHYNGTVFRFTPAGVFTVLKNLDATTGGTPSGSLIKSTDGNFYGLTSSGGNNGAGTVIKVTPAGGFTVLRHLVYETDGGVPKGNLVRGSDGNLYGTTTTGGEYFSGTIFRISTSGSFVTLRSLNSEADGSRTNGLVQGTDGNFYGMASVGGLDGNGVIYKISPAGAFSVIISLPNGSKGSTPKGTLVQGPDGSYYGMTYEGGQYGSGTIFKISTTGAYTVLRSFNFSDDGSNPLGGLTLGRDGNFYGMTYQGGYNGYGTIFKISAQGAFTVLYNFDYGTGANPYGSLILGKDGNFYGTTYNGGDNGDGTIFKFTPTGTLTVLHHMYYLSDGSHPSGDLLQVSNGDLYGTATAGGSFSSGSAFKMTASGAFTVLHSFNFYNEGGAPAGALAQGTDGNFYGMNSYGGNNNTGTIFKMTPGGTVTTLRYLVSATDGANPKGSLTRGSDGNFYGMTSTGGANLTGGTIFKITPAGTITVLRHLNKITDGGAPLGNLIIQKASLTANAQSVVTTEETPKTIVLTGSGSTALTYAVASQPKNGTLSGSGASLTYTPKINFAGSDSFTFTVASGGLTSAAATVSITVTNVNDAPVLAAIGNKTVAKGKALTFTATATDPDAGQTRTFSLLSAPAGAAINAATGAFSWTPAATGAFTFKVKVADNGSPALSDDEQITVTVTNPTTLTTLRLNSGGQALNTSLGSFSADNYFTGSSTVNTTTVDITNTTNDALYQVYRRGTVTGGSFGYSIPVVNGSYTVKLHFAEPHFTATGQRTFNVSAEGAAWLTNYDVVADVGAKISVVKTRTVTVSDGLLTLNFTSLINYAMVSAIEVLPASGGREEAIAEESEAMPAQVLTAQPNPFVAQTTLAFQVSDPQRVVLEIYDLRGNLVKQLFDAEVEGNRTYEVSWQADNQPTGMYISRLLTRDQILQRKLILQK